MLRRVIRFISLVAALLTAALVATPSQAVPAFARQTGKSCSTCHFQHYPVLNDYGQDFKAGGYVDMGKQPLIKAGDISLPSILNASIFTKIRYQKSSGHDGVDAGGNAVKSTHSGELQFPDEFALLFGGRITDNIGFLLENQFAGGGTGFLAGFKLPMMYKLGDTSMKAGVVPFLTDGLGASYGFELLSTGTVRNIRASESRSETSAHQYVFFASAGAASGLTFTLWDPKFYGAYTQWSPHHLVEAGSNVGGIKAGLVRAVWTPTFGDWALGMGVQVYTGSDMRLVDGSDVSYVDTKGTGLDLQAHGAIAGMPLGVYATYARAPGTRAGATGQAGDPINLFNNKPNARTAAVLTAELGVVPNKATVLLSYRNADNGAASDSADNAWTIGGTYQLAQNVQLQLVHSTRSTGAGGVGRYGPNDPANGTTGGKAMTTFMLSAAF